MPYIPQHQRLKYDSLIDGIVKFLEGEPEDTAGVLNYIVTKICTRGIGKDLRYRDVALVTGILENVKQEFYRRVAEPYEEKKCSLHGDVY